ncbi:hypothetical protein [Streptomyces cyaneofuscatus]|uniref:hypothetical protein n=1 Tax=Streptomyces cyaneofuscatus TaxID=66883 RepID=UPI00364C54DA
MLCPFSSYIPGLVALKAAAAHLVVDVGRDSHAPCPPSPPRGWSGAWTPGWRSSPAGTSASLRTPGALAARLRDVLAAT